jgi:hypothetical protein
MDNADRAEAESIRRFARFEQLRREIEEAARRAEANLRLENALVYSVRPDSPHRAERQWAA